MTNIYYAVFQAGNACKSYVPLWVTLRLNQAENSSA